MLEFSDYMFMFSIYKFKAYTGLYAMDARCPQKPLIAIGGMLNTKGEEAVPLGQAAADSVSSSCEGQRASCSRYTRSTLGCKNPALFWLNL